MASKPENEGAITVTLKGPECAKLRDLMAAEKRKNRKLGEGPTSYASIVIASLLERYKGEIAEQMADNTRIHEESAPEPTPF